MGLKNWLFGEKRDSEAAAIATLKAQINRYEHETRNLERQADEQKILAAKMLKAGNKAGAKQALKRRAIYMKRLNQVQNMLMNLQSQMDSIQTVSSTVETVKAMEVGTKVVKTKMQEVDVEKTEKVMDEVAAQRDEIEMMTEALSDTSLSEGILDFEDDQAIDEQLAQLETEMQLGQTEELPDISGLPSTPDDIPKSKQKEEDTSDLEEELKSLKKQLSNENG